MCNVKARQHTWYHLDGTRRPWRRARQHRAGCPDARALGSAARQSSGWLELLGLLEEMHACPLARKRTGLRANLERRVHAGMVSNIDNVLLPLVVLLLPRADEFLVGNRLFN